MGGLGAAPRQVGYSVWNGCSVWAGYSVWRDLGNAAIAAWRQAREALACPAVAAMAAEIHDLKQELRALRGTLDEALAVTLLDRHGAITPHHAPSRFRHAPLSEPVTVHHAGAATLSPEAGAAARAKSAERSRRYRARQKEKRRLVRAVPPSSVSPGTITLPDSVTRRSVTEPPSFSFISLPLEENKKTNAREGHRGAEHHGLRDTRPLSMDDEFEAFMAAYPEPGSAVKARRAYAAARQAGIPAAEMLDGIPAYLASLRRGQYLCFAEAYIADRRWRVGRGGVPPRGADGDVPRPASVKPVLEPYDLGPEAALLRARVDNPHRIAVDFQGVAAHGVTDGLLRLRVRSAFQRDYIQSHYAQDLRAVFKAQGIVFETGGPGAGTGPPHQGFLKLPIEGGGNGAPKTGESGGTVQRRAMGETV